ncbi:MAG TPA: peptide chain release factor N(5)-glutamine methyltransferase [Candidatus Xenobia bacterium]|nr:peptide chain release factor N(5)-glutamine methyltransferase [Candidatus Xenobia bacterium]
MTLRHALRQAIAELTAAQVPSASTAAEVLLMHVLDGDRAFLYAHPEAELSLEQERAYRLLLERRAAGTPTQYLTGRQEFWGMSFQVEPGVFIPRPETEHVIETTLAIVRERLMKPNARIVDVGTGTGCIALALASELPQAEIFATDISEQALAVARRNAEALALTSRVQLLHSDLLDAFFSPHRSPVAGRWSPDVVVSNPPYVSPEEADHLPREVREHEPAEALFSPDEGLAVTRRLVEQAAKLLAPVGWLVLELGYQMSERVQALLGAGWTKVEITPDLRGIPRVLSAQWIGTMDEHISSPHIP